MINVNRISPKHTKDGQIMVVQEFYLTTTHELMLVGFCSKCHDNISFVIPLQDLIDNCPEPQFTIKDLSDLHRMGIAPPPDLPQLPPAK